MASTVADDTRGFDHVRVTVNGVALHVVLGGSGPLVVLLHGWPESWVTWRHVMGPLRDAGFTVAVPDLRGFGDSEKPPHVDDYAVDRVATDVHALIRALGHERAHVVGHDWGGVVAWQLALRHDDVLDKLVIVNAPHPGLFKKRLRHFDQLKASYYMFVFQVPFVAERLVSSDDFRPLKNILKYQPRREGAFTDEDVELYVRAIKKPGALTAGLNYYRAAGRAAVAEGLRGLKGGRHRGGVVERPTLVVWGLDDSALPPENLDGLDRVVTSVRTVRIPQCSHWVQHDAPEILVRETLAFLAPS